ncbi:MAG TPA: GGDEF domain-containing phosphodiesterase, partial [Polyangiaceae bacterium]|nr:GGDEF domain-containing phosphodiesterase [Polyangiaceae bacterium]
LESAIVQPIQRGQRALSVGVSIGMGMFPEQGGDVDALMKVADSAMYITKQGARAAESTTMRQASPFVLGTRELVGALPHAIEREELELFYQTLHKATDGSVVGVEALLRWNHPEYGTIGPLSFVPLAERSGLIIPIGNWVLRQACAQNESWQSAGILRVPVAVNVSIKQLIHTEFVATVRSILEQTRLEPAYLQVEISEAAALQDILAVKTALLALNTMGVRVVIDDFGSGYTELCRLSELSVYAIKINQFLIRNMAVEPRDRTAVRAIVSMANAFGIDAIAKGVETEGQLEQLRSLGYEEAPIPTCGTIQGFVFSRPTTARALGESLRGEIALLG